MDDLKEQLMDARLNVGRLEARVDELEAEVASLNVRIYAILRAAIAHAGDTEAHPTSNNLALRILRDLDPPAAEPKCVAQKDGDG